MKIGLAARYFGQFGEASRNAARLKQHITILSEAAWSVQTILGEPARRGSLFVVAP